MNLFKKMYFRTYQFILYLGAFFINFNEPKLILGKDSIKNITKLLDGKKYNSVFIVSSHDLKKFGLLNTLINHLQENDISYKEFLDVSVNPTIDDVENGLKVYQEIQNALIVAIGGGSVLDCAKIIAARSTNNKPISKMKGLFKITHKLPLLIAVPTTAGTGSETTVAAVIVDKQNEDKYAINDPHLIPKYAVLDPSFLLTLPGSITSTTGMDALTHAIEAYLGRSNTRKTKKYALSAIKLIFENLEKSYDDPKNILFRENMQLASYQAGVAFTRAYVGYVHALAHSLGGKYNVAHGYANALILPEILKLFGASAYKKLAKIYDYVYGKVSSLTKEEKANYLINKIEQMNSNMNVKNNLNTIIKQDDLSELVNHAYKEAHPLYPVIKFLNKEQLKNVYIHLMNKKEED
jgi:alcohol dehydrogenase class IV